MLHHVAIEVAPADTERAVEFFSLLGFMEVDPPPSLGAGFRWLQRQGTQIHLIEAEQPTVPARGHLAVVAPEFGPTVARLRERGFELEPRREHWGSPRAVAIAPGGHRVELMASPPSY